MIKGLNALVNGTLGGISFDISLPEDKLNELFDKLISEGFNNIVEDVYPQNFQDEGMILVLVHENHGYFKLHIDYFTSKALLSKLPKDFNPVISGYAKLAEDRCIKRNDLTTEEIIYNSINKNKLIKDRPRQELYQYHNQDLMNELNEFMISVKIHLHDIQEGKATHQLPSIFDIDKITYKLMKKLKEDKTPLVKR